MNTIEPTQLAKANRMVVDGPNGVAYRWTGTANGLTTAVILNADVQLYVLARIVTTDLRGAVHITELVDADGRVYGNASQVV